MLATILGCFAIFMVLVNAIKAGKSIGENNDAKYYHHDTRVMLWLILATLLLR